MRSLTSTRNSAPWWRLRSAPPSLQETREAAHKEWRAVADRLRERFPKLGALMDEAEDDVLAHLAFPEGALAAVAFDGCVGQAFFLVLDCLVHRLYRPHFPIPGPRSDAADARR